MPDRPPSVAELLDEQLALLRWIQADLANVLGRSVQSVSELMNGRRSLDAQDALDLSAAVGQSADFWLQAQSAHQLWLAESEERTRDRLAEIAERRSLEMVLPVRDLIRRGLLPRSGSAEQRVAACDLLEVDDLDRRPPFPVSARRANDDEPASRQQLAWIACARKAARSHTVSRYDAQELADLAESLSRSVRTPGDFLELPDRYARAGVRLVHVDPFSGGRIDGISTTVDGTPVIALSGRGGRLDKVLFTLAHETAHVFLGHSERGHLFISEAGEPVDDRQEMDADALANAWLMPDVEALATGAMTGQRVAAIAELTGVSEAIVIGRLQKIGLIPWNSLLNKRIPSVKEAFRMWS